MLPEQRDETSDAYLQMIGRPGAARPLPSYTVTTLPDATMYLGGIIYVSNDAGGAVPAFSDGVAWRRCTDRAVVS